MRYVTKHGSNWCRCCFLFQNKTIKRSVQCHVLAQSAPDRRPNSKYPVNTSHRSDLCKKVSLQCYLVTTVIHIQSVCSQTLYVCIYTCCAQYGKQRSGNVYKKKKNVTEYRAEMNSYGITFWARVPQCRRPWDTGTAVIRKVWWHTAYCLNILFRVTCFSEFRLGFTSQNVFLYHKI